MKRSIVQQIAELPKHQQDMIPKIEVELEPVFEVTTPAPDISPLIDIVRNLLDKQNQPINITVQEPEEKPEKPKKIKIDIERDSRGNIKSLLCEEI